MAFNRKLLPETFKGGQALTEDLIGIGILLGGKGANNPNIENTLMAASIEGVSGDYRVLGLLTDWISMHLAFVNADRLVRLVNSQSDGRVKAYWCAVAQKYVSDRRFARLARKFRGKRVDLLAAGSDFQIRRKGEDPRFANTCLRVPKDLLRSRPSDVLSPSELAKQHAAYRLRIMIGPSYRADMWAALEQAPMLTASELARLTHGSFASAWKAMQDFRILHPGRTGHS